MDSTIEHSISSTANPWSESAHIMDSAGHNPSVSHSENTQQMTDNDWYVTVREDARTPSPSPKYSGVLKSQSNISMHAENSPNRHSLHIYPPSYASASSNTEILKSHDGTVSVSENTGVDQIASDGDVSSTSLVSMMSIEYSVTQGDASTEVLMEASMNRHSAGAFTEHNLQDETLPEQVIALSESVDQFSTHLIINEPVNETREVNADKLLTAVSSHVLQCRV